jgi:hypothetical protein
MYLSGGRVPEALIATVFLISLIASLYLSNYTLVSVAGLVTYTYMILAGHVLSASIILFLSLPFQILVAGPYTAHLIAYYPLVLIVRSLIYLRRPHLIFIPFLTPALIYTVLFHPIIEVPPLHYLLVCCVSLISGYSLRAFEELISYGFTGLEVPELTLTRLLNVETFLNLLILSYVAFAFSASTLITLLYYGLALTQSLLVSTMAGSLTIVLWYLTRSPGLRLILVVASTTFLILTNAFWLLGFFEESVKLFEEVLKYFG